MNRPGLRVLHLSMDDGVGGSGRSAYRIHDGLRRLGVTSRMLVGSKVSQDTEVKRLRGNPIVRSADLAFRSIQDALSLKEWFYPGSRMLAHHPWVQESDVVQLYALHSGWFSPAALPTLSRRKPLVWRMSDMWAFTGHCAFSFGCERWRTGCGQCPHLDAYPGLRRDTTATLWKRKQHLYERTDLSLVAPTHWMERLLRQSPLLNRFPIHVIPNGLDTSVFSPRPKGEARQSLGLPPGGRVLLFSSVSLRDPRKGGAALAAALRRVSREVQQPLTLLLMGRGEFDAQLEDRVRVVRLETIRSEERLRDAYCAADAFVLPSLEDQLPNTLLESMACGTPPVAFDVGGVAEAVRDGAGLLVPPGDVDGLADAIGRLLTNDSLRESLGRRARSQVESNFNLELQAKRFLALYRTFGAAA